MAGILTVALTAILENGNILLLQRAKDPYRGYWSLPGGKLHPGETVAEAAVREAREETGLACELLHICAVATETIREDGAADPEAHFVMFIVALRPQGGGLRAGEEGESAWYPLDALPPRTIPTDREMIARYVCAGGKVTVDHYRVARTETTFRLESVE